MRVIACDVVHLQGSKASISKCSKTDASLTNRHVFSSKRTASTEFSGEAKRRKVASPQVCDEFPPVAHMFDVFFLYGSSAIYEW